MPRTVRASQGGYVYHALNRGNGRRTVFRKEGDFAAFVKLLGVVFPGALFVFCTLADQFGMS